MSNMHDHVLHKVSYLVIYVFIFNLHMVLICVAGHQRQALSSDFATWYYGLGMAFLAVAASSLPCLFGITALFLRYFFSVQILEYECPY